MITGNEYTVIVLYLSTILFTLDELLLMKIDHYVHRAISWTYQYLAWHVTLRRHAPSLSTVGLSLCADTPNIQSQAHIIVSSFFFMVFFIYIPRRR